MLTITYPARVTADSAAATNDRPTGSRRSSDVCDRNTRRGGGRSPGMTHSIPVLARWRHEATPSLGLASTSSRARPERLCRRYVIPPDTRDTQHDENPITEKAAAGSTVSPGLCADADGPHGRWPQARPG